MGFCLVCRNMQHIARMAIRSECSTLLDCTLPSMVQIGGLGELTDLETLPGLTLGGGVLLPNLPQNAAICRYGYLKPCWHTLCPVGCALGRYG
ncbi:hypothetical protein Nepgr_009214 [Nepenthes gracilis]|uniref:Uncharacterized protein n=1 Tax=Nepenthes gracilis TaxID=150966 RepID=A0AAD3SAZ0_NEPGR|nr:hypothetical protein Nepgr_009214 [Nepenthes gracilis]